jgi:uncharacterized protein with PIN domain
MILDTAALIAILRFEAEAPEFARIIERARPIATSENQRQPSKTEFWRLFFLRAGEIQGGPLLFKGQDFSRTDVRSARS